MSKSRCTYRVPGGQWTAVSEECVTGQGDSYELPGRYTNLELRCSLNLTHPDGGILQIITDGISVNAQGLITSGDKLG